VTIQKNRRTKPRVVHIDKLAPVRKEFDGSWIHTLSKREEAARSKETASSVLPAPTEITAGVRRRRTRVPNARKGGRFVGPCVGRQPVSRSQRAADTRDPG
jgi:hypothetical protein